MKRDLNRENLIKGISRSGLFKTEEISQMSSVDMVKFGSTRGIDTDGDMPATPFTEMVSEHIRKHHQLVDYAVNSDTRWKLRSVMIRDTDRVRIVTKNNWEVQHYMYEDFSIWECKYRSAEASVHYNPSWGLFMVEVRVPDIVHYHTMMFKKLDHETIAEVKDTIEHFENEKMWWGSMVNAVRGAINAANSLVL